MYSISFPFKTSLLHFETEWQPCYYSSLILTHFCVGADSQGRLVSKYYLLPCIAQASFHLWGQSEVDQSASLLTNQSQLCYNLESPLHLGALESNAFNHPWTYQVSYVCSPGSIQVPGRTCPWSVQNSYSSGTFLDWGSWPSLSSQHVRRHSLLVSHCKRLRHECFSQPGVQRSAITTLNPLAAQRCVLWGQGFSSLVLSGIGRGNTSIYNKGLPTVLERMGQMVCSRGCTKQWHPPLN